VQEYVHQSLAGEPSVEETTVLEEVVEQVRCRWCGGVGTVELVPRPDAEPTVDRPGPASVRTAGPADATAGGGPEAEQL
jgi:hypothetical protein